MSNLRHVADLYTILPSGDLKGSNYLTWVVEVNEEVLRKHKDVWEAIQSPAIFGESATTRANRKIAADLIRLHIHQSIRTHYVFTDQAYEDGFVMLQELENMYSPEFRKPTHCDLIDRGGRRQGDMEVTIDAKHLITMLNFVLLGYAGTTPIEYKEHEHKPLVLGISGSGYLTLEADYNTPVRDAALQPRATPRGSELELGEIWTSHEDDGIHFHTIAAADYARAGSCSAASSDGDFGQFPQGLCEADPETGDVRDPLLSAAQAMLLKKHQDECLRLYRERLEREMVGEGEASKECDCSGEAGLSKDVYGGFGAELRKWNNDKAEKARKLLAKQTNQKQETDTQEMAKEKSRENEEDTAKNESAKKKKPKEKPQEKQSKDAKTWSLCLQSHHDNECWSREDADPSNCFWKTVSRDDWDLA